MAGVLIFYEPLPSDILLAVDAEARKRDVTPYDLVREILSERYKQKWSYSGLPYRPAGERFKLRVSQELRRRLQMDAAKNDSTIRGIVLSTLASHYGLAPISSGRRPRRSPA